MPRAPSRRYPIELEPITFGPIRGVTDSLQPSAAKGGRARRLANVYVPPGTDGLPVAGFPGFTQIGDQLAGGAEAQFIGQLRELGGTVHTVVIVGGKFYTYDWGADSLTETLEAADLSGAGVTLATTGRVFGVEFSSADKVQLVISDGANTPWMWDGTAGGGITKLTNAPVFYGAPWVYYAKLMGIKASERNTFVWSEESDATTGYEAGGFNNAWNPLGAVAFNAGCADNDGIYLAEERRTIRIEGAVDTAFQTSGTRSKVSETIGTRSPMLVTNDGVVLVDADARPHLIRGGVMVPMWADCAETVASTPRGALESVAILELPPAAGDMVLIGLPEINQSVPTQFLAFRISAGQANFIGLRSGFPAQVSAVVQDADGESTWLHAGEDDGYVYRHGNPDGLLWDDEIHAGTVAIAHEVIGPALAADIRGDKTFDRLDAVMSSDDEIEVTIGYTTPRGRSTDQSVVAEAVGGGMLWDVDDWDDADWADVSIEQRVAVGLDAHGRWLAPEIRHQALGERFGFAALAVSGFAIGTDPTIP